MTVHYVIDITSFLRNILLTYLLSIDFWSLARSTMMSWCGQRHNEELFTCEVCQKLTMTAAAVIDMYTQLLLIYVAVNPLWPH